MIFPMHRNLGVFTGREVPFDRLFAQWQGKYSGYTKGRDRSFHFGTLEHHIVGMISHLGPQLSLADGVGLAHKLAGEGRVSLTFTGDGAVWQLPVIFLIENNGYGLSTPPTEQYRCAQLANKGIGYGMKALTVDGNNILEMYRTVRELAESMRENPEPVLLECMTFRIVFKITDGFVAQFGKERVRNTPLCESAIVGAALGLSLKGYKAMVEMQFADFVTCGFNQIINNLAKLHYRWGANADVVVRMPCGAGTSAGPFHS
nr:thiamine pyrophosphate-dependent enzyme [Haliscomenobacter sp.]